MAFVTPERPTLPSLRSLDLPYPLTPPHSNASHDTYEFQSPDFNHPLFHRPRQISMSSSADSRLSSSPSPPPSSRSSSQRAPSPTTPPPAPKFKLVPASLESADAVLVIAPFTASTERSQPLLLVGDALRHVRCPDRQIAKGARLHPYKIVRDGSVGVSRRASMANLQGSV
ncbi:hypothetical protein NEOLEDRAFT_1151669 [Neolentinus lepideus HHB14362 ss-1]|uniref:Uncharacterized protein n=1 Tax=Neolentinus lepideus HHB14362 ss-1 TaxID=1314782 RepID=A0A165NQ32_9AGAM|nr:hypothetical protein NEOLEDRAFT_1151669 [Neolentinus lepideus HHB14362 ss-1]